MSTTHTSLTYQRFTKQVVSGPSAVVAAASLAELNSISIQSEAWVLSEGTGSTMPPLNMTTNPLYPTYDAFKYGSDYEAGQRKAYAGMVAYRFTFPADAIAATAANVLSASVSLYVDRWLIGGARLSAYLSSDTEPSTDWTTLREGDVYANAQLTNVDPRADQNATITLTFPAESTSLAYLYVVLTLEDYPSVNPDYPRRIEGGSLIVGESISVVFSRSVTADAEVDEYYLAQPAHYSGTVTHESRRWGMRGDNGLVLSSEEGWWSALCTFANSVDVLNVDILFQNTSTNLSGLIKTAPPGGTVPIPFAIGCVHIKHSRTGGGVTLSQLIFETGIPAPYAGVVMRLVVYGAITYPFAGDYTLSREYLTASAFWRGDASSVLMTTTGFPDVDVPVSVLFTQDIDRAYPNTTVWPIDFTPDDYLMVIIGISPVRITSDPGAVNNTLYGLDWLPGSITLKP